MPDSPLHIGFFSDVYLPQVNGVAISMRLVAEQLRALGHAVTIFAPKFPGHRDSDISVYRIPSVRYMRMPPVYIAVPGTPRAALALRRSRFDILHAHTPLTLGFLAYLSAHFKHRPLIYTYHTAITDYTHYLKVGGQTKLAQRAARRFSTITCNASDQIVAPSAKIERMLREQHVHRPIRIIPGGIDLSPFRQVEDSGSYRQLLGLEQDAPLLLSVGRLAPEKSLDFLIRAFARVATSNPQAYFVLAGDGSARQDLQRQAAACGFGHRILFLGIVDRKDLPRLLHDADLFLSASTTETQCLAVVEAIASGLPIVAVWDEALAGMVIDGANARVAPREVEAFGAAVSELIANRVVRLSLGRASSAISRGFSIEAQAGALVELYREAIEKRGGAPPGLVPIERAHRSAPSG